MPAGSPIKGFNQVSGKRVVVVQGTVQDDYATKNQPRLRGRLYIPNGLISGGATIAGRPTTAQRAAALSFGPTLFKGLPAGVAPVVYSKKNDSAAVITDYWVDDEWDIVRSRGNRATTRSTGTVP